MSLLQAKRESPSTDVRPPRQRAAATIESLDDARDPLRVSVRSLDEDDAVLLAGEIDVATAPYLASTIHRLLSEGRTRIVVDLEAVTYLDSAAIRTLVAATYDCARAGGALWVSHHPRFERLLTITGDVHRINIVDRTEARERMTGIEPAF